MNEPKDGGFCRGCALTVAFGIIGVAAIGTLWVIGKTILATIGN